MMGIVFSVSRGVGDGCNFGRNMTTINHSPLCFIEQVLRSPAVVLALALALVDLVVPMQAVALTLDLGLR
jgi:hypothetical protein